MHSSQMISEFKRKLSRLIRLPKRSILKYQSFRRNQTAPSNVSNSVTCTFTHTGIISTAQVPLVCARLKLKITSLLQCPQFSSQCRLLELVSKSADVDIMSLSPNELTNLLLYGHSKFTVVTNRTIIEATFKSIKSTGRFERN